MSMNLKIVLVMMVSSVLLVACSSKEANPYDEIFSNKHKFVPINTKELKEIK